MGHDGRIGREPGFGGCGRRLVPLALSALLAVALVACGDDDDETDSAGSQTVTTAASLSTAAPATTTTAAQVTVATTNNGALGPILIDSSGKTLYVFDRDTGGTSACTGNCAATWPPLLLPAGTTAPVAGAGVTGLGVVSRPDDGTRMQVTAGGKPLYTYAPDTGPGDAKGDGVGGSWHVARPA